jgi:hypothetical protein
MNGKVVERKSVRMEILKNEPLDEKGFRQTRNLNLEE